MLRGKTLQNMILPPAIIYGILGLFLGSFANVVSLRLHNKQKGIFFGRSACPKCNHLLSWYENLPVVSWLFLRGQCKNCKQPISWQYPAAELFFGILFFIIAFFTPLEDHFLLFWRLILAFSLGIIVLSDLRYMDIPDAVSLPTIGFVLGSLIINTFFSLSPALPSLFDALCGAAVIYGFFSLAFLFLPGALQALRQKKWSTIKDVSLSIFLLPVWILASLLGLGKWLERYIDDDDNELPGWIGGGDLRLGILMGLVLGGKMGLVAVFLSYTTAAIVMLPIYAWQKGKHSLFPFGPFLVLGTFLAMFWGEEILQWYLHLIGIA